ncbi:MAG: structural protein [Gammaproteobacteria bacterium]|nr:MAG: structural protein [Gammaproteobacteria bacterium]
MSRVAFFSSTRGLRNRNPGNIKEFENDNTAWKGERSEDTDPVFEEFESFEMGIRAMYKILLSYRRQGVITVRQIINRYAPPIENTTSHYVTAVVQFSGVDADDRVTDDNMPSVLGAMIRVENGFNPFSEAFILKSMALA